jgi:hypothetical protein
MRREYGRKCKSSRDGQIPASEGHPLRRLWACSNVGTTRRGWSRKALYQYQTNGDPQQDNQRPCPPLRLFLLRFPPPATQEAFPSTFGIEEAISVNPIKLTYQSVNESAMDLS